jgi:hypothetical protein
MCNLACGTDRLKRALQILLYTWTHLLVSNDVCLERAALGIERAYMNLRVQTLDQYQSFISCICI